MITMKLIFKVCVILSFFSIIIFSCKKDKNNYNNNVVPSIPKISTVTYKSGTTSSTNIFSYNSNGTLNILTESDGSYTKYEYAGTKIAVKSYNNSGILTKTDTLTLNSSGLAVNYSSSNSYTTYEYDVNGYLKKELKYNYNVLTDSTLYKILDGNTTTISLNGIQQPYNYLVEYQFLTDKVNTIGNENGGITFLGKQNFNLPQSYTVSGSMQYSMVYTYEYDSKGRVYKQIENGGPDTTIFTYVE